jgi:hypothetical protein
MDYPNEELMKVQIIFVRITVKKWITRIQNQIIIEDNHAGD